METVLLNFAEEIMLSVTPSKLNDYKICAHKFKLKHIEKVGSFTSSFAVSFGNSMHAALQKIHNAEDLPKTPGEVKNILSRSWERSSYSGEEEESEYFSKGRIALENYCKAQAGTVEETIGTESYMSFVVQHNDLKIRLGCKADRIALLPDRSLLIIDYKTNSSGKVPTSEYLTEDLSTFLYYVLARLTYPQYPKIMIKFLNVLTMASVTIEYDRAQIETNKRALWSCLKTLSNNSFPPSASENCAWCDFQDSCPVMNKVVDFSRI